MALSDHAVTTKADECRFADLVSELDEDDTATLAKWIKERRACGAIAAALEAEGYPAHHGTIRKHLLGACKCAGDGPLFLGAWK